MTGARGEDARFDSGHFDRNLICLKFDERLAGGDEIAFLLEPAGDGRFGDGLAEWRNLDRNH